MTNKHISFTKKLICNRFIVLLPFFSIIIFIQYDKILIFIKINLSILYIFLREFLKPTWIKVIFYHHFAIFATFIILSQNATTVFLTKK